MTSIRPWHCFFPVLLLAACRDEAPKPPGSGADADATPVESACDDGADNDGDGHADCDDLDCRVAGGSCELAPRLDRTVASTVGEMARFLYTGPDPVQKDADPEAFDARRVAILRGKVVDAAGEPLPGVRVEVMGHGEYGYTLTRPDGVFDMAVNGGAKLVARYALKGYLTVERVTQPAWQRYGSLPEVGLSQKAQSSARVGAKGNGVQVLLGQTVEDAYGIRQPIVVFAPGTELTAELEDGSEQELDAIDVFVTEYPFEQPTLDNGLSRFLAGARFAPGTLPSPNGISYGLEFSVEQAEELGAKVVHFSEPASLYVENFLNLPVGTPVPLGYYARGEGQWQPTLGGRVVEILEEAEGRAVLDLDGDGAADDQDALDELGITDAELAAIANRYEPGVTLWRAPIEHFSPWTALFPKRPPPGAITPSVAEQVVGQKRQRLLENPSRRGAAVVEKQALQQSVGIAGTPYSLHYQSDRTPGYKTAYQIEIPLLPADVPDELLAVSFIVEIAGRTFEQVFDPEPNLTHVLEWDGKDAFGRLLQGPQTATIFVAYIYPGDLSVGQMFGAANDDVFRADEQGLAVASQSFETTVGVWDNTAYGLGGFGLDVLHGFDPAHRTLFFGNGDIRAAENVALVIGQPVKSDFDVGTPDGVAVLPDGSVVVTDDQEISGVTPRILRVSPEGETIVLVGPGADGPAADIQLDSPQGVVMTDTGELIVADSEAGAVRKISPDGSIETLIGSASEDPIVEADLSSVDGLALGPGQELFAVVEDQVAKLQGTKLVRVAGGGETEGDGGPAREAKLIVPSAVAVAADGTVFVSERGVADESGGHRIRKVTPEGIIQTIAGSGEPGFSGDGGDARVAQLHEPRGLALAADGTLYVADQANDRVRRITPDGIISTAVGGGDEALKDGQLAERITIDAPDGIAFAPDGALFIATVDNLFRVAQGLPQLADAENLVPSSDGRTLFKFDARGKHLATIDAMTGVTELEFGYDEETGVLVSCTTKNEQKATTSFTRDSDGSGATITAPFDQATTLAFNDDGMLESVEDPALPPRTVSFEYEEDAPFLLAKTIDPKGGEHIFDSDEETGLLKSTQAPTGYLETLTRVPTAAGHDVTVETPKGRETAYGLGGSGDLVQRAVTNADGTVFKLDDQPTKHVGFFADGTKTVTTFDADEHFGGQVRIPSKVELTLPSGRKLVTLLDTEKELSDSDNGLSIQRWTERSEVNGRVAETVFDRETRTATTTSPAGRVSTSTLDKRGRVVASKTPGCPTVAIVYDAAGRVESVTAEADGEQRINTYAYESDNGSDNGFLRSQTDPLGLTTRFNPDAIGRVTLTTLPDENEIAQTFDDNDNIASLTPPGRSQHLFEYAPKTSQLTDIKPPLVQGPESPALDTGHARLEYDKDDALTNVLHSDNRDIELTYEDSGRLNQLSFGAAGTTSGRRTITYGYDAFGRVADVNRTDSVNVHANYDGSLVTSTTWTGAIVGVVEATYDDNLFLDSLTVNEASTVSFDYDDDGLITQAKGNGHTYNVTRNLETGFVDSTSLGTVISAYVYNGFGEVTALGADFQDTTGFEQLIARDEAGRISSITEKVGTITRELAYEYDERGRLKTETRDGVVTGYTYDANGNRTSLSIDGIELLSADYDEQDRVTAYGALSFEQTFHGDLQRKTDGTSSLELAYDELGNLLSATISDETASTELEYVVDGLGRRIAKRVDGTFTKSWLYRDQLRPISELDANSGAFSHFVYADGIGAPDFILRNGVPLRVVKDHLGSVRMVVDATSGVILQRIEYDAFGRVLEDTNPGFQPFGFGGGLYDPDTRLVRFGARDYDAELGRWTSKDPIGFEGGDTNVYGYVTADPVNVIDPRGLFGVARCLGGNFMFGPLLGVGGEGCIGVFWDISGGKISLFTATGKGSGLVTGISAGVGLQDQIVWDSSKFWGSGSEVGPNLPFASGAINGSTTAPRTGFGTPNAIAGGTGISLGGDIHYLETETKEQLSIPYWRWIKSALGI
jgi:RHS repeat-associated protein